GQGALLLQLAHLLARLFDVQVAPVQKLVGFLERRNGFGIETAPAQPFGIDADRSEGIARTDQVRRNVLADGTRAAYHGMRTYAHELMHGGQSAQYCPITDMDMPGKLHAVGNDGMVAELTIVRNVHISHDPVVAAQA